MEEWGQEIMSEFISEFRENIEDAMSYILQLEKDPGDSESVHALFRNFHTIKGNASVVGFEKVVRLSHETETLLDCVRDQTVEINSQIIEILIMSADALTDLVDEVEGGASFEENKLHVLINTLSDYLPCEASTNESDTPLAFNLRIVDEASQIFDQIVFLSMSGSFESGLKDIQEKTARLSKSVENASYPRASNLLNLFQNYMTVIKAHNIPFSEHNFGLFNNIFLTFTENLMGEIAGMLGIVLVTTADFFRQDGRIPWQQSLGKEAGMSPLYAIIDLSDSENSDGATMDRVEKGIKDVFRDSHEAAIIDPFKRATVEFDAPCFASSLEALHHIIEAIEKGE